MRGGVNREVALGGEYLLVPKDGAFVVNPVPQWNWDSKETLAADEPISVQPFDPIRVTSLHIRRVPPHFVTASNQFPIQVGIAAPILDVPLAAGHDLKWSVALFEELHRVIDWARLTNHLVCFLE